MTALNFSCLSFAFPSTAPLFHDFNLRLEPGWTGLVGSNGAGKTSLLRLIAGELEPTDGTFRAEPSDARIAFCQQGVERLDDAIFRLAERSDSTAQRLKGELRLSPADLGRWETLSPGERRRWQIGAALADEPDVLLLDEPTNHLDGVGRDLLAAALLGYWGVGIVVSHDRSFLNELTSGTLRLRDGTARLWPGSYDTARVLWQAEEANERAAWESCRKEERKLRRRLADKRRQRGAAEGQISTRKRIKGPRDHDGRSMAAKGRARSAEARLGREVGKVRRQLEKAEVKLESFHLKKEKGRSLFVDFEPSPRRRLISLETPELRAGDTVVLRDVALHVERTTRLRIAGPNGSGKSTLLRSLVERCDLPPERVLYLPQELGSDEARRLLEDVLSLPGDIRARVLDLVAALGVDPGRLLRSTSPSPGEARKLLMASGLGRRVWLLLLDEPTNHLDLPAIERLEEALAAYPGALVLVTHDEDLALSTAETTLAIEEARLRAASW